MRRELQLQLTVEPPVRANHRSLRRCFSCGNYTRPFVEMEGVIRCERCAKRERDSEAEGDKDNGRVEAYGLIA